MRLFTDGSKFKAVNQRDKNLADRKPHARNEQPVDSTGRYLVELDRADRDAAAALLARVAQLKQKIATVHQHMRARQAIGEQMRASGDAHRDYIAAGIDARPALSSERPLPFDGRAWRRQDACGLWGGGPPHHQVGRVEAGPDMLASFVWGRRARPGPQRIERQPCEGLRHRRAKGRSVGRPVHSCRYQCQVAVKMGPEGPILFSTDGFSVSRPLSWPGPAAAHPVQPGSSSCHRQGPCPSRPPRTRWCPR
jgi:hypothetical protein